MKKENGADQGKFPDLSGDGKITMKDILIGRGVVKKTEGGDLETGMMGGGSVDDAMKYGGGGNIMIKTVEVSMKVPEKQKRGTGAAMTGTKFSGTY